MTARQWYNVLPMMRWMELQDEQGNILTMFRLIDYSIHNGSTKAVIQLKDSAQVTVGLTETPLWRDLTIRLYVPIELHQVPQCGLSPKMVYRVPPGCRIEEASTRPAHERLADQARQHSIIPH